MISDCVMCYLQTMLLQESGLLLEYECISVGCCRLGVGKLSDFEAKALDEMKVQLAEEIKKGNDWSK